MSNIQEMFQKAKEHGDDKVSIAIQTYELVDKHIRKLDSDLAKFEAEMKEKGRLSQTETEEDEDEEEDSSSKKSSKKPGASSKKKAGNKEGASSSSSAKNKKSKSNKDGGADGSSKKGGIKKKKGADSSKGEHWQKLLLPNEPEK